jgi:hypothetical protein
MRFKLLLLIVFFAIPKLAFGQRDVTGTVTDSATNEPLAQAGVTVLRDGKTMSFVRTDNNGIFNVKVNDGDLLSVSYLGYKKRTFKIPSSKTIVLKLVAEAFTLKEVKIQGNRITGRPDTTTYDLTRFANERDNSLKDVLKKLPGVDVAKDGTIEYNGKPINRFTIEGLDLSGGRYNKLTEALKAHDVSKAEVIEHDQPVKALQGKIISDDVAMNIKLKPSARGQWGITLKPYVDISFPMKETRIGASADALMIGSKSQSFLSADYDRTGRDLSQEDQLLANSYAMNYRGGVTSPQWFDVPSLQAPIDDERFRFNRSHNESAKTISKTKSGCEKRITAGYFHSAIDQMTDNTSLYYFDNDKPTKTDETKQAHIVNDRIFMDLNYNMNTEKGYGNEYFLIEGTRIKGLSALQNTDKSDVNQQIKMPELHLNNTFSRMFVHKSYTLSLRSDVDFHYSPNELYVNNNKTRLSSTLFHTDENASFMLSNQHITQNYTFGTTLEQLNIQGGNTMLSAYANPYWEYRIKKTTLYLNTIFQFNRFTRRQKSFFNVSPSLSADIKCGKHSEWKMSEGYSQTEKGLDRFVVDSFNVNYRTRMYNNGIIPKNRSLYTFLSYEYKRPIMEFFWLNSIDLSRVWKNTMTDMTISKGSYLYNIIERNNRYDELTASSKISKGFFALHLKTRLDIDYSRVSGSQLSNGTNYDFTTNTFALSPQIIFSPSWGMFTYSSKFSLIKLKTNSAAHDNLRDWVQRLSYTQTIGKFDITLSANHFHNELYGGKTINTLLADASAVLRLKNVRLEASLRNAFNKRNYATTYYSDIFSSTTSYILRPREIILSAQINI